jgi:hypothetical protein
MTLRDGKSGDARFVRTFECTGFFVVLQRGSGHCLDLVVTAARYNTISYGMYRKVMDAKDLTSFTSISQPTNKPISH